MTKWWRWW